MCWRTKARRAPKVSTRGTQPIATGSALMSQRYNYGGQTVKYFQSVLDTDWR